MGMDIDFSQLKKALGEVENKVKNKITKEALNAGSDKILDKQKDLVPVDTGETKRALNKGKLRIKRGAKVIDIGLNSNVDKEIILRGYYNNYGSRGRGGTFWINESFEQSKSKAIKAMGEVIKEGLKK